MKKKITKRNLIILFSFIVIISLVTIYFLFIRVKYEIIYKEGEDTYHIYQISNKIIVKGSYQVECIKAPCDNISSVHKVSFAKKNLVTVNNFMKDYFKKESTNKKTITENDLTEKQFRIIKAIIFNDESFLDKDLSSSNTYTIVTDQKYLTMQDDGGSNYNVYYEIDMSKNIIIKYEDHYIGFKGYEYRHKEIYDKVVDKELIDEIDSLIKTLIFEQDLNKNSYGGSFKIKDTNNNEYNIYNEEDIKKLKEYFVKIDNLDNN